jgi:glycosyltransferase involved in cell wall biosynthesis
VSQAKANPIAAHEDPGEPPDVVIAVLTYRRNDMLPALLAELVRQAEQSSQRCTVMVVDNNPEASARDVVASLRLTGLEYVHEPEPGIAAGRNRALELAAQADAIVFLDDDETPEAGWLPALLTAHRTFGAAAVTGPVVREYPEPPSRLVDGMRFWDRVRRATGTQVPAASTANLLLDVPFLRANNLRFDARFGLSGGSDTLLTRQIVAAGGRIIWCDEAVVIDHVEPERLTREWLIHRSRRIGNTHSRASMVMAPGAGTRARLVAQGISLVALGTGSQATGWLRRQPERQGYGIWRRSRGVGIITGAVGRTHFDYRRTEAGAPAPGQEA